MNRGRCIQPHMVSRGLRGQILSLMFREHDRHTRSVNRMHPFLGHLRFAEALARSERCMRGCLRRRLAAEAPKCCWQSPKFADRAMNIHHLELFYYVARHGGITEAVRNIPYGIQQPAVSGQVAQLEEYLGVTLFQRRPFALSAAGEKLYQFISPFFSSLDAVASDLQGGKARHIRIGASTIVLRDHLPEFFRNIRKKYPNLKIALREGYQAELESLLQKEEIDLAITILESKL